MGNKKLSSKLYWAKQYVGKENKYSKLKTFFSYSMHNYEYFDILKKKINKTHKNVIEIGCAPGSLLIKLYKKFKLQPHGVEYTKNGVQLTENNFKLHNIENGTIIHSDVFDTTFQQQHKNKYDLVVSFGFIEHFDNLKKTLDSHTNLARKKGLVIVTMPNLKYWNKCLVTSDVLAVHNIDVMDFDYVKNHIPKNAKLVDYGYYGGLFNVGLFSYKNAFFELIRKVFFVTQRIICDPIFILLYKLGIKITWKKTTPGMYVILKKK